MFDLMTLGYMMVLIGLLFTFENKSNAYETTVVVITKEKR